MGKGISIGTETKRGISVRWQIFKNWVQKHFNSRYNSIFEMYEQDYVINTIDNFQIKCFYELNLKNSKSYLYKEMTIIIKLYKVFNNHNN